MTILLEEVISTLRMERNAFVVRRGVQHMQGKVLREMTKSGDDEHENEDQQEHIVNK